MITLAKAKELLRPGDIVFTSNGREIVPAKVRRVRHDCLDTDVDLLFYDDHGVMWWLTEKVAKENVT